MLILNLQTAPRRPLRAIVIMQRAHSLVIVLVGGMTLRKLADREFPLNVCLVLRCVAAVYLKSCKLALMDFPYQAN